MPNGNTDDEEQIRARLLEVARRYPQAEMARRIGAAPYNVSRYLRRGNRIPGAFLAAVARELGVNATWLLQGEGTPWVADIRSDRADVGGNLLELVSAMASISRLRLGSLVGKDDAKSLRDLNDALGSFDRVRTRLADASRPAFSKVLDDWTRAVQNGELDRARHLAAAAEQVERLCPDPALALRHLQIRAWHENDLGHHERSLALRQRIFLQLLSATGEIDERSFMAAFGVVAALINQGRVHEGVRYAEAAQILAPHAANFPGFANCQSLYGWGLIALGDFERGLPLVLRALPRVIHGQENTQVAIAYAMYLCGTAALGAIASTHGSPIVLGRLLFLSPWSTDASEVAALLRIYHRSKPDERGVEKERIAVAHLAALEGRHKQALETWKQAEADEEARNKNPLGLDFALLTMRAQLHRLAGDRKRASRALAEADKARQQTPANVSLDLNWLRIHWRNAALLADPTTRAGKTLTRQAAEFAAWAQERGLVAHQV